MTTEQRAREWITTKIDGGMTVDELVAAAVEFANDAIAAERLACKLVAENYQQWVVSDGQIGLLTKAVSKQVASEIAQAIGDRNES